MWHLSYMASCGANNENVNEYLGITITDHLRNLDIHCFFIFKMLTLMWNNLQTYQFYIDKKCLIFLIALNLFNY